MIFNLQYERPDLYELLFPQNKANKRSLSTADSSYRKSTDFPITDVSQSRPRCANLAKKKPAKKTITKFTSIQEKSRFAWKATSKRRKSSHGPFTTFPPENSKDRNTERLPLHIGDPNRRFSSFASFHAAKTLQYR